MALSDAIWLRLRGSTMFHAYDLKEFGSPILTKHLTNYYLLTTLFYIMNNGVWEILIFRLLYLLLRQCLTEYRHRI